MGATVTPTSSVNSSAQEHSLVGGIDGRRFHAHQQVVRANGGHKIFGEMEPHFAIGGDDRANLELAGPTSKTN